MSNYDRIIEGINKERAAKGMLPIERCCEEYLAFFKWKPDSLCISVEYFYVTADGIIEWEWDWDEDEDCVIYCGYCPLERAALYFYNNVIERTRDHAKETDNET